MLFAVKLKSTELFELATDRAYGIVQLLFKAVQMFESFVHEPLLCKITAKDDETLKRWRNHLLTIVYEDPG